MLSYDAPQCCYTILANTPYSAGTVYLRMAKSGSAQAGWTYTGSYSTNGKTWTVLGTNPNLATAFTYFGLYAIRQEYDGNGNLYAVADFNYFKYKAMRR
jgi:hypothetical protein